MAGRPCTICKHKSRNAIDLALVEPGASIRGIARQFRVSDDALTRHVNKGHIAAKIKEAQRAHEAVAGENLLARIEGFHKRFKALAEKQQQLGDDITELKVYQTQIKYLEMEGRATGVFRDKVEIKGSLEITGPMSECSTCHWWLRCNRSKKREQEQNEDPCTEWKRLATEGLESGWS